MLGIQIGNEFLDLLPGTILDIESDNPFLQFNDEVKGSFSLPFEVLASEKNLRLLNYAGILQKVIDNTGIDARIYQNGIQHSSGKIKIEQTAINLNRISSGKISCYYLTGSSDFFQEIKGKQLRSIDMGGDRIFSPATAFRDHVTDVLRAAPNDYEYAFYPVINRGWPHWAGEANVMNWIEPDGGLPEIAKEGAPLIPNRIVPFPYLKRVLLEAVNYAGWTIESDILTDPDFEKITMINFKGIDWAYGALLPGSVISKPVVTFNLVDHLPDITIAEFLIALKNRMGWWYDYDFINKKITIKHLTDLVGNSKKDMTKYSSPLIPKKVSQENKIYALKNVFLSGGGQPIDITKIDYQGTADMSTDLPAAAEALADQVYLVTTENNYYQCVSGDGDWVWEIMSSNNADYAPEGSNEEIITQATTVDMERYDVYVDLAPRIDAEGMIKPGDLDQSWSIHLCFFFGLQENKAGQLVPFASHHIYDSNANQLAAWSLAFKAQKTDGTEVGLYDLNWKSFLSLNNSKEEFEVKLYLPFHEYLKSKFSDQIVIDGVKMFVKQKKSIVPYKGIVDLVCVRVLS